MACSIELVQATESNQDITAALEPQEKEESTKTLKQVLTKLSLTLKVPITTVAGNNFSLFFFYFSEKTSLEILCELSAWQTISHEMSRLVFSEKKKKKKKK